MNSEVIGSKIRTARKSMNMTQRELGNLMCTDGKYISKLENGKPMPSLLRLVQISRLLDRSCDYFISEIDVNEMQGQDFDNIGETGENDGYENIRCGGDSSKSVSDSDVIRMVYSFLDDMSAVIAASIFGDRGGGRK